MNLTQYNSAGKNTFTKGCYFGIIIIAWRQGIIIKAREDGADEKVRHTRHTICGPFKTNGFLNIRGKSLFLAGFILFFAVLLGSKIAFADDCGQGTAKPVCECGDTVVGDFTLVSDMNATGHGLIIGADGVVIDGNGHTLAGDGAGNDYGINNSGGYDNIVIENFAGISDFNRGIYLSGSTGSTIQDNTISSNSYGIYLSSSSSNDLTGNTVSSNAYSGIYLSSSSSLNNLINNAANSNNIGIRLLSSPSNTLTGNSMSGNVSNLSISGTSTAHYVHTIDATNMVEGKPVYYLCGVAGTEQTPLVYDANLIGDIGMFACVSCSYVELKNADLSANNLYGVFFYDTNNSTIRNITANSGAYGIYLNLSSDVNIIGNSANSNSNSGISLSSSPDNNLTANTTNYNAASGIRLAASNENAINGNFANYNLNGIYISNSSFNSLNGNTANFNGPPDNPISVEFYAYGIHIEGGSENLVSGNTANSNTTDGIYVAGSSFNTLNGNTTNSNLYSGIRFHNCTSNTVADNNVSSNPYGIYLYASRNNNFTGNEMAQNTINLYLDDPIQSTEYFDNTIDPTNTVEGKPVYYLYNVHGTEVDPIIYDGDVVGDIGMFACISCSYVEVKNADLSANNWAGVYLRDTNNCLVQSITTPSSNAYGVFLRSSSFNTITENNLKSADSGLFLISSSDNNISQNTIWGSTYAFQDDGSNSYFGNGFYHCMVNPTLAFTEIPRLKAAGESVDFDIQMKNTDGSDCDDCNFSLAASPFEPVAQTRNGNEITGGFTPTRSGTYSLIAQITDANSNVTKRSFLFFVNASGVKTMRYYVRHLMPAKGQYINNPYDYDGLQFDPPTSTEYTFCSDGPVNFVDELPDFPLSYLTDADFNLWYKSTLDGFLALTRYDRDFSSNPYVSTPLEASADYIQAGNGFTDLNWTMDYSQNWYRLNFCLTKITVDGACFYLRTTPSLPCYADFTWRYTDTPAVKSISNTDIVILSATEPADDPGNATVVLDGTGTTNFVLDNFNRPFLQSDSLISSDGTTTITPFNVEELTTLTTVPLEITPSSGTIEVRIHYWGTSPTFYKKWTENLSATDVTAQHSVGDLKSNACYIVLIDGLALGKYFSDSQGQISFTLPAGYSSLTLKLEPLCDLTDDCVVDMSDLVLLAQQWLHTGDCSLEPNCADFDGSELVDFEDFARLSEQWRI